MCVPSNVQVFVLKKKNQFSTCQHFKFSNYRTHWKHTRYWSFKQTHNYNSKFHKNTYLFKCFTQKSNKHNILYMFIKTRNSTHHVRKTKNGTHNFPNTYLCCFRCSFFQSFMFRCFLLLFVCKRSVCCCFLCRFQNSKIS